MVSQELEGDFRTDMPTMGLEGPTMETIAVVNQKGGAAKTTTAANLAATLGRSGKRVLVIDLDPQASLTSGFGIVERQNIFEDPLTPLPTQVSGVDLVPGSTGLMVSEARYFLQRQFTVLREILEEEVQGLSYDFVILDCAPNLSGVTANAIVAAHRVLIPSPLDGEVLRRVDATLRLIDELRAEVPDVTSQIHGLVTRYRKTKPELTLLQFAQRQFDLWLESRIRESATLYTRASMRQLPAVQLGAKNSAPVVDHLALARELQFV